MFFFWYRLDILIFVFLQDFVAKANGSVRAGLASQRSVFDIFRHEEVKPWTIEVGIFKRKQESKKTRKHAF